MIVGVVGSRGFAELERVELFVMALARKYPDAVVVSGGADGVDWKAEEAAAYHELGVISYRVYDYVNMRGDREFSIETVTHGERAQEIVVEKGRRISPPFFDRFWKAAHFRNGWVVDDVRHLVAFWDGVSTGTADTLRKARAAGVPTHVTREWSQEWSQT